MKNSKRILDVLQRQAWQRAVGELRSMIETVYDDSQYYDTLDKLVSEFIDEVNNILP